MRLLGKSICVALLSLLSSSAIAQCNIHDHGCSFHSIGSQTTHSGSQAVHHTRGIQTTPNIAQTANGLYGIAEWKDNASGQKADIDIEALLPDSSGAYVISNNAHLGGAPASVDPFAGIPNEHNRHVDTFQYQTTFQNNTATAVHSVDANGRAPIPNPKGCISSGQSDSCEHIQISGNIPTGIYEFTATNYDVFRLADPSSPEVKVYAGIVRGDPNSAGHINGEIVYPDQVGEITGALPNRGDALPNLRVGFVNHDFKPHAEGVVLDNYQRTFIKNKWADPHKERKGDTIFTYQRTYRDYTGVDYQDTIGANGKVTKTVNKGVAWRKKNVYTGTNFVSKRTIIRPKPVLRPQPRKFIGPIQANSNRVRPNNNVLAYNSNPFAQYSVHKTEQKSLNISTVRENKIFAVGLNLVKGHLDERIGGLKSVANSTASIANLGVLGVRLKSELNPTTSLFRGELPYVGSLNRSLGAINDFSKNAEVIGNSKLLNPTNTRQKIGFYTTEIASLAVGIGEVKIASKVASKATPVVVDTILLSKSKFGHTFSTHGANTTKFLINRAKGSNQAQGQFLDNQVAAKFIIDNLYKTKKGAISLPIPKDFPARIINPDGSFSIPSLIRLIPGGKGVKTAFPKL